MADLNPLMVLDEPEKPKVLPIHTSDRINFKRCRRAWNWQSPLREYMQANKAPMPLAFGTAIHGAMEIWYDPDTWWMTRTPTENVDLRVHESINETIELAAIGKFQELMKKQRDLYFKHSDRKALGEEDQVEYDEHMKLGEGMLRNYFQYSKRADSIWEPVATEVPFEIPIMAPEGFNPIDTPGQYSIAVYDKFLFSSYETIPNAINGQLLAWRDGEWLPVVYRGRIDLIMRRLTDGAIFLWDHKTAARLGDPDFLNWDEQMGSYGWAYRCIAGVKPHGIIYSELYKGVPEPPKLLSSPRKGCSYSVSKSQDTSYELLLQTVKEHDRTAYEQGLYDEVLAFFRVEGKQYHRRIPVIRNDHEYDTLGENIAWEAIDMLDNPRTYPNPTKFGCQYCMFSGPCQAMNDGSDYQTIIDLQYRKRD